MRDMEKFSIKDSYYNQDMEKIKSNYNKHKRNVNAFIRKLEVIDECCKKVLSESDENH